MKEYYHTLVIGSGCAGYNAADNLHNLGVTDIAVVTEGREMGTSRNTGSDKQTYYKLTLAGEEPDSVYDMARTLFDGGAVHGDTVLIEAACSVKCFMKLVHLGLPFPTNPYGAYIGYKTDHDPRQRATSCGPLTSRFMTEALEREVIKKGVPILDSAQVVKLLTENGRVYGLVYYRAGEGFTTLYAQNIILATGGPAGIYADTVFPASQTGGTGLALAAGAKACNLQEWQYGLASVDFRWNVSGTYQQVLPRYISVDALGNEYEFLNEYYSTAAEAYDRVFLKGYQWPFDSRKTEGSSRIDLLVSKEINERGRTVYMDFRRNPSGLRFDGLSREAYEYLRKSDALLGTPVERLAKMNPKAIELYKNNGIDLYREPLKIAVCAQHCNGGIAVDANWETNIRGLYAAGEAAGTFGVYRPGGSALNSAMVGSMRAAEHIAKCAASAKGGNVPSARSFGSLKAHFGEFPPSAGASVFPAVSFATEANFAKKHKDLQERMSQFAAYNRDINEMQKLYDQCRERLENYFTQMTVANETDVPALFKCYDLLVTQTAVLSAILFSAREWSSHGGAVVKDAPIKENDFKHVIITYNGESRFEPVKPLPVCDDWFERDWNV
ncbi:MAG: FAD-binding protein [Defluviitaleaceae bacterium]|nr:FAD-binding protein [Defluviitaleaceae bacterium]